MSLLIEGFLQIELTNIPKILPMPTETPVNAIKGILDANSLKPNMIMGELHHALFPYY